MQGLPRRALETFAGSMHLTNALSKSFAVDALDVMYNSVYPPNLSDYRFWDMGVPRCGCKHEKNNIEYIDDLMHGGFSHARGWRTF